MYVVILFFSFFHNLKSANKDFVAEALSENQLLTRTLQSQVESLIRSSSQMQKSVEIGKQQQQEQMELLQKLMVSETYYVIIKT